MLGRDQWPTEPDKDCKYFLQHPLLDTSSETALYSVTVGVEVKKTEIFPYQQVLREGTSAMFCCVPPRGVSVTSMTFNDIKYPLHDIGARVKAIAVHNLTIPAHAIKALLLSCMDTTGKISFVWNYVSCKFELLFSFNVLFSK